MLSPGNPGDGASKYKNFSLLGKQGCLKILHPTDPQYSTQRYFQEEIGVGIIIVVDQSEAVSAVIALTEFRCAGDGGSKYKNFLIC